MNRFTAILSTVVVSIGLLAGISMFTAGCSNDQETLIAKQIGVASAVTWIGIDDPSATNLTVVKGVVTLIRDASEGVSSGESYYQVLTPVVDAYIVKLPATAQLIAKLGASWFLSGIDTLFALHPEWIDTESKVVSIVQAYCDGALVGLSMSPNAPAILAAKRQTVVRIEAKKQ